MGRGCQAGHRGHEAGGEGQWPAGSGGRTQRPCRPPTDPGPLRLPRGEHWDLQVSGPPVLHAGADFAPPRQHPESRARSLQRGPGGLEDRAQGQRRGRRVRVLGAPARLPDGWPPRGHPESWSHSPGNPAAGASGSGTRTTWLGSRPRRTTDRPGGRGRPDDCLKLPEPAACPPLCVRGGRAGRGSVRVGTLAPTGPQTAARPPAREVPEVSRPRALAIGRGRRQPLAQSPACLGGTAHPPSACGPAPGGANRKQGG